MEDYDVFVYCGGKCGSMSLYETFIKNGYKCCQTHGNEYWINTLKKDFPIFDYINKSSETKKVYIIDCYRTPIERTISSFFQNICLFLPNYKDLKIKELIDYFNNNLLLIENYHPINEVLKYYNLPQFDTFNFEKKYNIIEKDNKVFIKILFDDINQWGSILSEIFGKHIDIFTINLTSKKEINALYDEFKTNFQVNQSYIDNVLSNDTEFKIYNTVEQQEKYINKWRTVYKTLIGKNGYLFLHNDSGNEIKIHSENLSLVKEGSLNRYKLYKNKLLIIVFPNKSLIYKDYLPDGYNLIYRPAFDMYNEYFNDNIIDGLTFLKNIDDTFYKTDTHINLNGAYIIYCAFINKIKELFNIFIENKNIVIHKKTVASLNELDIGIGDLTWFNNLGNQLLDSTEDTYYYSDDFDVIYLKYIISIDDPLRMLILENNTLIDKTNDFIDTVLNWEMLSKHIVYKKNKGKLAYKCLIFYDSFLLSTLGLYLDLFEEVYLSKSVFTKDVIELINPDYIFEFRVERFLF